MDRLGRGLGAAAWLGLLTAVPGFAAGGVIPLESFVAEQGVEAPAISPDGKKIVYITRVGPKALVVMLNLTTKELRPILQGDSPPFTVERCDFKTDDRLLCRFAGVGHNYNGPFPMSRLVGINADGKAARALIHRESVEESQFQDRILHWLPNDPDHVLVELTEKGTVYPGVYRLDVHSGALALIVRPREPIMSWIADRDGVVRFGSGFLHDKAQFLARSGPDASWRVLEKFKRFDDTMFEPIAFGPLPNQLFVMAPYRDRDAVWEMDVDENRDFQLVYSHDKVDVERVVEWPVDHHIAGFVYDTDRPRVHFVDGFAGAVDGALEKVLPGCYHQVIDASRDGSRLLIYSYSDVSPGQYHLFDVKSGQLVRVGLRNPALEAAQLAPMKPITVPGPGGAQIPGFLTLPVGAAPDSKLPAVVYPHGGPYSRDSWGYDPMVQVMASRGYAVLQLNYRGSTGYGHDWLQAGFQGWGTVMHDDITAGAHWLVAQGIADPARMCIVGWSYGGYAALIGVEKEPQLYRCAVAIAGVSSLRDLIVDDRRFYGGREGVEHSTGSDRKTLKEESPVEHADRVKVPVLLIHGIEDYTVLVDHSKSMARALAHSGVPNELVLIKEGEHSLLRNDMRLTVYSKLTSFLDRNIGGAAAPFSAATAATAPQ